VRQCDRLMLTMLYIHIQPKLSGGFNCGEVLQASLQFLPLLIYASNETNDQMQPETNATGTTTDTSTSLIQSDRQWQAGGRGRLNVPLLEGVFKQC